MAKATKIMTPKHETTNSDRAWSRLPERLSSVITDNDGEYRAPRSGFDFEKEPSSSESAPCIPTTSQDLEELAP